MRQPSTSSGWEMAPGFSAIQPISAGTTLFRQDAQPQLAAFIESGWVKLVRLEEEGQEKIIALCPPESLPCAAELIAERAYTATAIALTRCELHSITASAFFDRVGTDLKFTGQILRALSRQSYAHEVCSAQLKSVPPDLRLEQLLWQLLRAQDRNGATRSGLREGSKLLAPVQNQELAQIISVSPEHFSRMLRKKEKEGVIRRSNGWLIFPDPERLWRAPEIESLVESNQRLSGEFNIMDMIIA